jgi:phage terminase large subunit-like protein
VDGPDERGVVPDAQTGGPRFAAFCEHYVRHTKGRWAREPLLLEDWQRQFWWEALEFDPSTGLRVYSEVGLGLPRKNGKSVQASAAGLYFLVADGEAEPEVYVAAAARNQAGIVLGQSRRMAQESPPLSRHVSVRTTLIECPRNGGVMRSLSADAALQHGLNPYANIIDELHAHRTADLYTAICQLELNVQPGMASQGAGGWSESYRTYLRQRDELLRAVRPADAPVPRAVPYSTADAA